MAKTKTYTLDGTDYEIRYTIDRIEIYENTNGPILTSFSKNAGMFSLRELRSLIASGLKVVGGDYVPIKEGRELAIQLIEEMGYVAMLSDIADALERDCGFFFKGTTIG